MRVEGQNKSAFIRRQPLNMSANDVVKAAKAEGLKISKAFVHTVRSSDKRNAKTRSVTPPKPQSARKSTPPASSAIAESEASLRALMLRVGTGRSRKVLESLESLTWN